jgi:hypothetical protein
MVLQIQFIRMLITINVIIDPIFTLLDFACWQLTRERISAEDWGVGGG